MYLVIQLVDVVQFVILFLSVFRSVEEALENAINALDAAPNLDQVDRLPEDIYRQVHRGRPATRTRISLCLCSFVTKIGFLVQYLVL